jgi:hypothetical protein
MRWSWLGACVLSLWLLPACGGSTSPDSGGKGGTSGTGAGGASGNGVGGIGAGGVGGGDCLQGCGPTGSRCCAPGSGCAEVGPSSRTCHCTDAWVWQCSDEPCTQLDCGPTGSRCCQPGTGCGSAGPGGSLSCDCRADFTWSCTQSGGGAGGATGCGPYDPHCPYGTSCCGGRCVNLDNDPYNCGACANDCSMPYPFMCKSGTCSTAPCYGPDLPPPPGGFCCGYDICQHGQLCCDVQGPYGGPICITPTPEQPTCPIGQ